MSAIPDRSIASGRRAAGGRHARRRRAGFTLVELMVVILVILLLVGILLPAVARIRIQARVNASLADIAVLAGGIDNYHVDEKEYPPSAADPDHMGVRGNLRLRAALVTGGKNYGCQHVPTVQVDNQHYFADRFTRPYMYYRFERNQGLYINDHNPVDPDNRAGPADANTYARYFENGTFKYYRTDYIIMSAGADGVFLDPKGDIADNPADDRPESDDITNFLSQ